MGSSAAEWASAAGSIAAALAAVGIAVHASLRDNRMRRQDDERRARANAALLTISPNGGQSIAGKRHYVWGFKIANDSTYGFTSLDVEALTEHGEQVSHPTFPFVKGGAELTGTIDDHHPASTPQRPRLVVTYSDHEGNRWRQDDHGRLEHAAD